jgi:hypothetical protein
MIIAEKQETEEMLAKYVRKLKEAKVCFLIKKYCLVSRVVRENTSRRSSNRRLEVVPFADKLKLFF